MKKSRIVGYALTLAATMMVGSAMGQTDVRGDNYVELKNQNPAGAQTSPVPATLEQESLVQKGLAYGYYAKPSEGFHPGYVTPDWKLTKDFKWEWKATTIATGGSVLFNNLAGPLTNTATGNAATDYANYVEIKVDTKGKYVIQVEEKPAAAFGSCAGEPSSFNLIAFDAPSFSVTGTPSTDVICNNLTNKTFSFDILSSGTPQVKYKLERRKVTINPSTGAKTVGTTAADILGTDITLYTEPFTTKWLENQSTAVAVNGGGNNSNIELKSGLNTTTFALASYVFTVKRDLVAPPSGVIAYRLTVEGVNGLLSRKADHNQKTGEAPAAPATFTLYGTDGLVADGSNVAVYDIFVGAAPKTGPVYHLSNNIAK